MATAVPVHMTREPEPDSKDLLLELLEGAVRMSFGDDAPDDTEILVNGQLGEDVVNGLPLCRHVIIPFAGLQPKTRDVMRKHPGVRLHNLHHNASMTAEMAMALLLACSRRIVKYHNTFAHDDWEPRWFTRDARSLHGKTVVVLGWGAVGKCVGAACRGFGMEVIGIRRQADGDARGIDELHELLPKADFFVVTLPLTEETEGLVGEEEIRLLPEHAIVVNVGRGKVIDEKALYDALKEERIDSAGLDVWYLYPKDRDDKTPPSQYPFGSLPNVVMTPHVAGGTQDTEPTRMRALAQLIKDIVGGDEEKNLVSVERGY
ncbi:MAG: hypothetical protein IH945_08705 [Armatimonadetes bacterium]|nr:hypothetical protein [Armatimonadota bacterium]